MPRDFRCPTLSRERLPDLAPEPFSALGGQEVLGVRERLERAALLGCEACRNPDRDLRELVAAGASAEARDPAAGEPEDVAGLRPRGDLEDGGAVQRGDLDLGAE